MQTEPEYIRLAVFMLRTVLLIVSAAAAGEILKKIRAGALKRGGEAAEAALAQAMTRSRLKAFDYRAVSEFLESSGAACMFRGRVGPPVYLLFKCILTVVFLAAAFRLHVLLVLPAALVGFKLPDVILKQSNQKDNEAMLPDVKELYDILKIQTGAGEHITTALSDCYMTVRNRRLKKALQELTSTISGKHDIEGALSQFKGKFSNDYLDALVISISQSLKTGQAERMFQDLSNQIEGIDRAILAKKKQQVQNRVLLFQILLYIGIIAAVMYSALAGSGGAFQLS